MKFLNQHKSESDVYDPIMAMAHLQEEINDFFKGHGFPFETPTWERGKHKNYYPYIDLRESEKHYFIEVEVPGLNERDITCEICENVLSIHGEKKDEIAHEGEELRWLRKERRFGKFHRSIPLPNKVDEEKIYARVDKGILKIELEKTIEAQTHAYKIHIERG